MVVASYLWKIVLFATLAAVLISGASACQPIQAPNSAATEPQPAMIPTRLDDAYQFPIVPGSNAWVALESHQAMLAATQLPAELLPQISTHGLIKTILAYPMFGDMLAFFELQDGFTSVATQFNGLQELWQRPDAAAVLLAYYQAMDPAALDPNWSLEKQGEYTFQFIYIEMMLAQEPILMQFDQQERKTVVAEVLAKLKQKEQAIDIYGYLSVQSSAFLLAKILSAEQYSPFLTRLATDETLKTFFARGGNTTMAVLDEIITNAQAWVEQ